MIDRNPLHEDTMQERDHSGFTQRLVPSRGKAGMVYAMAFPTFLGRGGRIARVRIPHDATQTYPGLHAAKEAMKEFIRLQPSIVRGPYDLHRTRITPTTYAISIVHTDANAEK